MARGRSLRQRPAGECGSSRGGVNVWRIARRPSPMFWRSRVRRAIGICSMTRSSMPPGQAVVDQVGQVGLVHAAQDERR